MSDLNALSVPELLGRMMGVELYVINNELLGSVEDLAPYIKEHLIYMIALEKSGKLFASGPTYDESGAMTGEGLTIVRASTFAEAEEIARGDPFVKAGIRKSHVQKWRINEGRLSLSLDLSDCSSKIV